MNLAENIIRLKKIVIEFYWAEHNYRRKYDKPLDKKRDNIA